MHQPIVVFNVPLDGAAVSGLYMALDASDLAVDAFGRLDEIILVVGSTSRHAIVQHEGLRIRVELLSLFQCVLISVRPRGGHDGNGVSVVVWALFTYAAMSNASVEMSSVPVLDFDSADHFFQTL